MIGQYGRANINRAGSMTIRRKRYRNLLAGEGLPEFQKKLRELYLKSDISRYIAHIIFSLILGLFAGFASVVFYYLLNTAGRYLDPVNATSKDGVSPVIIFIIPVIGGLIVATMTRVFPALAREKGVVNVIKAVIINNGLIPLKVTVFHLFAPIISMGFGAPLGPEGPAAKIGSGMGSFMSQIFRLNQRDMRMYTAAGAGAAIAAVFNAPIAGVFFGIEVILLNDLKNQALSALIISSVVADILSRALLGNHHIFHIPVYNTGSVWDFPFFLGLGILCGVCSLGFFAARGFFADILDRKLRWKNPYMRLIPVTVIFGLVLIKYHHLFGIGYNSINEVLNGRVAVTTLVVLLLLRLVFMALFLEAGAYGGTFAPSLVLGVFLGYSFASIMNYFFNTSLDPVTFALVGMGGVLAGVNSIPLTAILLVFEVTNDYHFILPLMFVSIIAYLSMIYVHKETVYSKELRKTGIDVSRRGEVDLLGKIKVQDLKKTDFEAISYRTPFRDLLQILMGSLSGDVFVVNDKNQLVGVVSLKEVRQAIVSKDLVDLLIAGDITVPVPVVTEEDQVSVAIKKIETYDIESIPVVKSETEQFITGVLTHQDILAAYNTMLNACEIDQFIVDYSSRGETGPGQ